MKNFSTTLKNETIHAIAIGGFDGIHVAHRKLIDALGDHGALIVIEKENASLTPKSHRCKYIKAPCIFLPFAQIKEMSAEEFIHALQNNFTRLEKIIIGYDFRFGKNATADAQTLKRLFDKEVMVIDEVQSLGVSVHSKTIREALTNGDLETANRLLGRYYAIEGSIVKGQGLGSKSLYPTLNLEVSDFLIPKSGIYASFSHIKNVRYPSVTFIGTRLSTDGKFSIETHILHQNITAVEEDVEIHFVAYMRENKKFETLEGLKAQIKEDISQAAVILSRLP